MSDCSCTNRIAHLNYAIRTLISALLLTLTASQVASRQPETVTATALVENTPVIDGALTEQIWWDADIYDQFRQDRPNEGEPASELTTVQIAYGPNDLFVGVEAYDREPDRIVARLARRDDYTESDWIEVHLDPYNDNQTGYYFRLNAAGAIGDGYLYDDTREDETWDSVWEGRARIHDAGWTAEFRIPYRILRFTENERPVWGINVVRNISRKNERDFLAFVPRNTNGWVSHFSKIEGLKGLNPSLPLDILPYTTFQSAFEPASVANRTGRSLRTNIGADLRYGLSPNVTFTATVNPDFGQVEADPAVLNLSAFETRFEERRPFFVNGGQIFQTPIDLFYSRRIGRKPGRIDAPDGFDELDRPQNTTIVAAGKLTGKTQRGTSFGVLQAMTASEFAIGNREDAGDASRERVRVEPTTSYAVGRLRQDLADGSSSVGALVTAVNRAEGGHAYSGGVDWNARFVDRAYRFRGQVAGVSTQGPEASTGYAALLDFDRLAGWATGGITLETYSPGFDANDIGFVRRTGLTTARAWTRMRRLSSWGLSRRLYLTIRSNQAWNDEGLQVGKSLGAQGWIQFDNYWWLGLGATHGFRTLDDRETRGGPTVVDPAWTEYEIEFESDDRRAVNIEGGYRWWSSDEGGSWGKTLEASIAWHPTSNIELRFGPEYRWRHQDARWLESHDRTGDGTDDTYLFGSLDSKTLDFTTRASITFSPTLTLQIYAQPFLATGDYGGYKTLAEPGSYTFDAYDGDLEENHDFNRRSFKSNSILRWEYRPGSTLFVVWSQARDYKTTRPNFNFGDLRETLSDEGSNILMVKFNYWLGL